MRTFIAFMAITFLSGTAIASDTYEGSFTDQDSDDAECEGLFDAATMNAEHWVFGPRISVFYMTDPAYDVQDDTSVAGFWHGARFVTNYGPDGDVIYEEELVRDGEHYAVTAAGFATDSFALLDFVVSKLDADEEIVCNASASYFGTTP